MLPVCIARCPPCVPRRRWPAWPAARCCISFPRIRPRKTTSPRSPKRRGTNCSRPGKKAGSFITTYGKPDAIRPYYQCDGGESRHVNPGGLCDNPSMRNPSPLRSLPAVHQVLEHPLLASLKSRVAHAYLVAEIQQRLEKHREALRQGGGATPDADALAAEVAAAVAAWFTPRLQPVVNLTGTLLHTNLGRAPLSEAAVAAVAGAAGTVNLEYDLDAGRRGDRDTLGEQLLCRLGGAEGATGGD